VGYAYVAASSGTGNPFWRASSSDLLSCHGGDGAEDPKSDVAATNDWLVGVFRLCQCKQPRFKRLSVYIMQSPKMFLLSSLLPESTDLLRAVQQS
jgi:hypothetical protein